MMLSGCQLLSFAQTSQDARSIPVERASAAFQSTEWSSKMRLQSTFYSIQSPFSQEYDLGTARLPRLFRRFRAFV
jgi:hypothetical protein